MEDDKALAEIAGPVARLHGPAGPDRIHEIKHDGYRLIVQREGKRVRLSWPLGPSVWETEGPIEDRRGLASEIIGPPVRPQDCSSMSIFEIVYWVARKGGAVDFEVSDQSKWNAAIAEVLNKTEQLDLTYRQSKDVPPEKDVAYLLRGVCVEHPFQNSSETEIAESAFDSPVLELGGEHDILRIGQIVYRYWFGSSEAVARLWPFQEVVSAPLSKPSESAAADPRTDASKTDRQIFRARDFLWSGAVPAISWGDFEKSVGDHIEQSGGTRPSPESFKRFKGRWWELILAYSD